MTFKQFLFVMIMATGLVWGSWLFILFSLDPYATSLMGRIFFYLTLNASLMGTFTLIGILFRHFLQKNSLLSKNVARSFRQSVLLSFLFIGALFLKQQDFFNWWTISLLILFISFMEFFFLSLRSVKN